MSEQQRIEDLESELSELREKFARLSRTTLDPTDAVLNRLLADRAVLENLPDFVSVTDREHRILYLNHTIPSRNVADLLGTSALLYVSAQDRERYSVQVEEAWVSGETRTFLVHTIGDRWWETRFVPIKEHGQIGRAHV